LGELFSNTEASVNSNAFRIASHEHIHFFINDQLATEEEFHSIFSKDDPPPFVLSAVTKENIDSIIFNWQSENPHKIIHLQAGAEQSPCLFFCTVRNVLIKIALAISPAIPQPFFIPSHKKILCRLL